MRTHFLRATILVMGYFSASAQVDRASIVGTVTDKSGAVVPEAVVRVSSETTNTSLEVITGESGNYSAPNLVPGSYTITIAKPGFSRAAVKGFVVQVGQAARLDYTLDVGSVDATVEIVATAPLLQTEDSESASQAHLA